MEHDVSDTLDARLREARPAAAAVDPDAFDADLLARATASETEAPRRRNRAALPAAALAASVVAIGIVLTGGPAATHGPHPDVAAAAMRRAASWFAMPPGKVLHYRSVIAGSGAEVTQEVWQSTDRPTRLRRTASAGSTTVEVAGDGDLYDGARNTIYAYVEPSRRERAGTIRSQMDRKIEAARAAGASTDAIRELRRTRAALLRRLSQPATLPSRAVLGDPLVDQVRRALASGRATVGTQVQHDGVAARPITSRLGDSVRWVLWTAADDARPLELTIDHGEGTPVVQSTVYQAYELLPASDAQRLVTLRGAHPDAPVVRSRRAFQAAERRLFPNG